MLMLLSGEVYVSIWRAISYLLNLALKNPLNDLFTVHFFVIFMKYTLYYAETNSPTLSMYSQVSSIYKWGGGVGVGEGLEGRWGWLKKLKMENPNLLIYYYLNSSEPIIICKFTWIHIIFLLIFWNVFSRE